MQAVNSKLFGVYLTNSVGKYKEQQSPTKKRLTDRGGWRKQYLEASNTSGLNGRKAN